MAKKPAKYRGCVRSIVFTMPHKASVPPPPAPTACPMAHQEGQKPEEREEIERRDVPLGQGPDPDVQLAALALPQQRVGHAVARAVGGEDRLDRRRAHNL